jgi:HEPN domain-containing protein
MREASTIRQNERKVKSDNEQIETMARIAERAAREYIASRIPSKETEDLEITVEVEANDELIIDVEVSLEALPEKGNYRELVEGAVEAAHLAIKNELDEVKRS